MVRGRRIRSAAPALAVGGLIILLAGYAAHRFHRALTSRETPIGLK